MGWRYSQAVIDLIIDVKKYLDRRLGSPQHRSGSISMSSQTPDACE
jgi:hypothetical protein